MVAQPDNQMNKTTKTSIYEGQGAAQSYSVSPVEYTNMIAILYSTKHILKIFANSASIHNYNSKQLSV